MFINLVFKLKITCKSIVPIGFYTFVISVMVKNHDSLLQLFTELL